MCRGDVLGAPVCLLRCLVILFMRGQIERLVVVGGVEYGRIGVGRREALEEGVDVVAVEGTAAGWGWDVHLGRGFGRRLDEIDDAVRWLGGLRWRGVRFGLLEADRLERRRVGRSEGGAVRLREVVRGRVRREDAHAAFLKLLLPEPHACGREARLRRDGVGAVAVGVEEEHAGAALHCRVAALGEALGLGALVGQQQDRIGGVAGEAHQAALELRPRLGVEVERPQRRVDAVDVRVLALRGDLDLDLVRDDLRAGDLVHDHVEGDEQGRAVAVVGDARRAVLTQREERAQRVGADVRREGVGERAGRQEQGRRAVLGSDRRLGDARGALRRVDRAQRGRPLAVLLTDAQREPRAQELAVGRVPVLVAHADRHERAQAVAAKARRSG